MNDVRVVLMDMPVECKGQVRPVLDGDYYIFINAHYNTEQQREIYNHEMRHILENHLYIVGGIEEIELAANDKAALLNEIKRVEESGLPLHHAIVRSEFPDYDEVEIEVIDIGNGWVYELPKGMKAQSVLLEFDQWLERVEDEEDRYRDHQLAVGDDWITER